MEKPQKTRRPGRPPATNTEVPTSEQILHVAARMFMELGYDSVSMEQVALECGITKAMIYYYFTSKSNLFIAAMVQTLERVRTRTIEILNRDEPLYDRLLTIMQTRLRIDTAFDFNMVARNQQTVLDDAQRQTIRAAHERLVDSIADAFREASETGHIRQVDPILSARVYMTLLMVGISEQKGLSEETLDIESRARRLLDFMWIGVACPDAP